MTVNCHQYTECSDFIGGIRPVRNPAQNNDQKIFEWVDGPLLNALINGHMFLADEISLAEDSVLERFNSILGQLYIFHLLYIYEIIIIT